MDVRICGPNLYDQRKGTFHVHRDGCRDLGYYGPGRPLGGDVAGEDEIVQKDATVESVVLAVYDNGILDERQVDGRTRAEEVDSLVNDFWFAPCCAELPHEPVPNWNEAHGEPALYWMLSFAEAGGWLGGAVVLGEDMKHAVASTHVMGINPGGEVLGFPVPGDFIQQYIPERLRNVLLDMEQVREIDSLVTGAPGKLARITTQGDEIIQVKEDQ